MVPVITLNGYEAGRIPFTYYVEAAYTRTHPRDLALDLSGPQYTVALGVKPTPELSLFLYAQRAQPEEDIGREGN